MPTDSNTKKRPEQNPVKVQKKLMIEALTKTLGIVSAACKNSGISRDKHYYWMNRDPKYKAAVEDIAEISVDFAETKLLESIKNGSDTATIFYLKTKGKKRGYVEKQEIEVTKSFFDFMVEASQGDASEH